MTMEQPGKFAHSTLGAFGEFVHTFALDWEYTYALPVHDLAVFLFSQPHVGQAAQLMKRLLALRVAVCQGF